MERVHRDILSIIHKYVWRFNYNRCIQEYNRIYVPHWNIKNYFCGCKNYMNNVCPLMPNNTMCPTAMYRTQTLVNSIYNISIRFGDGSVGELPKNY